MRSILTLAVCAVLLAHAPAAQQPLPFDTIIRNGVVYDGSGEPGLRADVGATGSPRSATSRPPRPPP